MSNQLFTGVVVMYVMVFLEFLSLVILPPTLVSLLASASSYYWYLLDLVYAGALAHVYMREFLRNYSIVEVNE